MRVGELFAGYGGLGMAVKEVFPDAEVAWVSEFDKGPSKVLAHRFPGVPNHGDITRIDWTQVPPVDVITGGSPCQDLSHAGKRQGMTDGTRSNLWVAMREAIAQLRPGLVVWENVRGALSASADSAMEPCAGCVGDGRTHVLRALGRVLGDLSELGYDAAWCGLRAADVGAAHGRFRVFVLAWDAAIQDPNISTGGERGVAAPGQEEGGRAWPDVGGRGGAPSSDLTLLPTPAVNDMGEGKTVEHWDEWTAKMQAKHGNGNGHGKSLAIEAQRLLPTPEAADASGGRKSSEFGGKRPSGAKRSVTLATAIEHKWGDYAAAIQRWEHVIGRPAPEPTQTSAKGNPQLSARFTEFLMGVPDGWITDVPGVTRNEALKMCGNGVVPQQGAAALRWLLDVMAREVAA